MITSIICSSSLLHTGFQVYHDATHSAVSSNPKINETLAVIGSILLLWDFNGWIKHHSIMHHGFTGDFKKDAKDNRYLDQDIEHHMCDKNTNFALVQEYIEDGKNFLSYFVGEENTGKIKYKSLTRSYLFQKK